MPIIVDANRSSDFAPPQSEHAKEILHRISTNRMRICLGGKLTKELLKTKISSLIQEWIRAGRAHRVKDDEIEERSKQLLGKIDSDDEHIVALAQLTGCRLLFSDDQALIRDFKNTQLVSPKGKVVKSTTEDKFARPLFERYGA
ncbi:hypothetical protein [Roseovarius aestuariivivens]|uniref:hypothetical protein n=1 Tax=Roseovarius aestuariivivens TaxID=1888910 RepID=UPI0010811EFB|nr:hypothetical protein [Roseovarius aestuariivivens]